MLHRKLLDHGTIEQEFTCERFSTTLLFADISGFTRLSARLNAEQLKIHTNHYFTLLIDVVARYGGDIIKFCGDAVMILWPAEHAAPRGVLQARANAMQASMCALVMLSECGKYDVGRGEEAVSLRLHCGMGSGDMYAFLVGTENRWEFLVAGDPLRQIGVAEPEAKQGEVILSKESWELASAGFVATKTPQGNWLLKESKDDAQAPHAQNNSPTSPVFRASAGAEISPRRWPHGEATSSSPMRRSLSGLKAPEGGAPHGHHYPCRAGSPSYIIGSPTGARSRRPFSSRREGSVRKQSGEGSWEGTTSCSTGDDESNQRRRKGRRDYGAARVRRLGKTTTVLLQAKPHRSTRKRKQPLFYVMVLRTSPLCHAPHHQVLTVTRNVNTCSTILEEHRLQASEFLASYIKAQFDGGVEKTMAPLSTALRGYTQESARHAIESNTVEYLAGIRFVTTIFINIYGLEGQLENGGGFMLQQTMDLGVASLSRFGGVLRQFVVDDKGCVMIGAFGLPQYSYEDNEIRGISASEEIIRAFKGLNLAASIGITTGQVYCGFVGSSKRCEYAMMGCSVNLSARLMASAPKNTIQVDFEVWSRARKFFDFETLAPIKAKGYVDLVPVFRPLGQALAGDDRKVGGQDGDDILVGATAELEAFASTTRRMQASGYTRPVVLIGHAGAGKTHLLRSAQLQQIWRTEDERGRKGKNVGAEARNYDAREERKAAPLITTVCRNVHANTSYYAWRTILHKIFNLPSEDESHAPSALLSPPPLRGTSPAPLDPDAKTATLHHEPLKGMDNPLPENNQVKAVGQAAKVVKWMEDVCPDMLSIAPLLGDVMFTGFKESRTTSSFPPDVRHRNLVRLVVGIVRGAVEQEGRRLMLVIEDAQWMDSNSMKLLLKKLARTQLKVLIVISARPFEEYFETVPHEFTAFRDMSTTIEMSPLSPADCLVLARRVIGEAVVASHPEVDLLPPGSDVVLHEKSGAGNPLFVRNIAATLKNNLVTTGEVTPLASLPTGFFHSLTVSRFDALEPQEQTVLKAATVIGATFEKTLLLHMLQSNSRNKTEHLHAALLKLIEANFISRSVVGQTERFSFVHATVQEMVYEMMLTEQKENLHEVCAQWYEKRFRESAHHQSVIMHHWIRSGNTPKKVEYHLLAAAKAREALSSEEVIQHMLALIAIAFGKDMATATVISLEPFLKGAYDPQPHQPNDHATDAAAVTSSAPLLVRTSQKEPSRDSSGQKREAPTAGQRATIIIGKKHASLSETGTTSGMGGKAVPDNGVDTRRKSKKICSWLFSGDKGMGGRKRRRRNSSLVFPTTTPFTEEEVEAEERKNTAKTAARLGCAVGNLSKRQRAMLVAKDQEWLWASDLLPCTEFSDPIFTPSMVARWIGEIGLAHLRMGRLLPAHNHMQEALAYLGFKPVPKQGMLAQRTWCLAQEYARQQPRDVDDSVFAAGLYSSIADISIKMGMGCNLAFINCLAKASTRGVEFIDRTPEGIRLMVNLAQEELERGRHDKVETLLERALALSADIDDPVTTGIVLTALGTYNAGQGMVGQAEDNFAEAFAILAPAGDTSRCGEIMVESAYAQLCSGNTKEALFMFQEVRDVALARRDDFLSQASLHGVALVHAITGSNSEALCTLAQLRCIVEEDWARRRGRRGRKAATTEGTSHASLVVMEALDAYLAAARGEGERALRGVCRSSHRFSRQAVLRFSSGLQLYLVAEACFTMLEHGMLPPDPKARQKGFAAAQCLVRTLGRFAQVFDVMSPLYRLGRARLCLLHGLESFAKKALDIGLVISEEFVHFPYAEGLLLMHSTRLECLPMEERRARARRGRKTLHYAGARLIPTKEMPGESGAAGATGGEK
ncbi:unnamed protein product [Ascophyllum nodosum]